MPGGDERDSRAGGTRTEAVEMPRASEIKAREADREETHNPLALGLGLLVVVILFVGTWFVVNALTCDPLFSDAGLSHSRACR